MNDLTRATGRRVTPARPALRADASRNREAVLRAAEALFHERGFDVPLAEIAAAAGVGRATLHRNFTTRREIALAIFDRNVADLRRAAEPETGEPPGFETLLDLLLALHVRDGGLAEAAYALEGFTGDSTRLKTVLVEILRPAALRGVAEGRLRPEAAETETLMLLQRAMSGAMLTGGTTSEREARAQAVRRLLLHGLAAGSP